MKTTKQMADVMLAYCAGYDIQARELSDKNGWVDIERPVWNWARCDYRVKE